jgi:heterodisulfide reductase subunit A
VASIGVYVCDCGTNIAGVIDVKALSAHASRLRGVSVVRNYPYMCSGAGQELIANDIRRKGIDRVVVAACSPSMHEHTFRTVLERAGLNPYLLEIVNLREQCSWVHAGMPVEATEKAKGLVAMGVARASLLQPLRPMTTQVTKSALVVGGGIAGITAALNLSNTGYEVCLVENEGSIGGRMAQLDKTFPTLDCSPCILTPLMAEVAANERIRLLTNSEVKGAEGVAGDFRVKISVKPRYVDAAKCIGCGICTRVCPVEAPNGFDEGLSTRKAVYMNFPQAVPRVPSIDPMSCLHFRGSSCNLCSEKCPTKAIDFAQAEREVDERVGAIIIATGFGIYLNLEEYGLGRSKNVITGIQLERLACPSGPTGGRIVRPSDGAEPKTVVIALCAGSRDERHLNYCCVVGCMAGLKHAWYVKAHDPAAKVYVMYNDMRAAGKGYEEFYGRLRELGVVFIRGKPEQVEALEGESVGLRVFDQTLDEVMEIKADLLVLETGLMPSEGSEKIREVMKIAKGTDGFLLELHPKLHPVETYSEGIYLAGAAQGAKDIPSTVAQALAASGRAVERILSKESVAIEPIVAEVDVGRCSRCMICLSLCPFKAMKVVEHDGVVMVEEAKCKGCGICVAACPSSAIDLKHCTEGQIAGSVRGAIT